MLVEPDRNRPDRELAAVGAPVGTADEGAPDATAADRTNLGAGREGDVLAALQVDDVLTLADVRAWLRQTVREHGWSPPVARTLALLTTELVANAQRHGPTRGRVALRLVRSAGALRVEVQDEGATPPVVRHPPPEAVDGRGMLLVQHLARAWGSELLPDGGKTVWFALDLAG